MRRCVLFHQRKLAAVRRRIWGHQYRVPGASIMTNKRISIFAMPALIAALIIFVATATADEHSGIWKLNPAKSKYSPGPAPKALKEKIELDEHTYKVEGNGTAADGRPTHFEFDAKFDGKDYPIRGIRWADM